MVRGCSEREAIQCEEPEINAFHLEDNQAVRILLDHCKMTRRQECLWRLFVAFLLLSSLAVFFFFRITPQPVDTPRESDVAQLQETRTKPHAHLTVLSTQDNRSSTMTVMQWDSKNGLAHISEFHYDQEKRALIVASEGYYNIYLQITFRKPELTACHKGTVLLTADVNSRDLDNIETLMTLSESFPCSGLYRRTVYTSGIHLLKKGTELSVNVTNIELVDKFSETKTYFGASFFEEE